MYKKISQNRGCLRMYDWKEAQGTFGGLNVTYINVGFGHANLCI